MNSEAKRSRLPGRRNSRGKDHLVEVANEVFGDLPDGAFFAAAYDAFGLTIDDFAQHDARREEATR